MWTVRQRTWRPMEPVRTSERAHARHRGAGAGDGHGGRKLRVAGDAVNLELAREAPAGGGKKLGGRRWDGLVICQCGRHWVSVLRKGRRRLIHALQTAGRVGLGVRREGVQTFSGRDCCPCNAHALAIHRVGVAWATQGAADRGTQGQSRSVGSPWDRRQAAHALARIARPGSRTRSKTGLPNRAARSIPTPSIPGRMGLFWGSGAAGVSPIWDIHRISTRRAPGNMLRG